MITIGRIIHYVLKPADVDAINRRRTDSRAILAEIAAGRWPSGVQAHVGNHVHAGMHVPGIVTAVWPGECGVNIPGVNAQLFLDGNDSYWVTSVKEGQDTCEEGTFHYPERD